MAIVHFTKNLSRFYPHLVPTPIQGATVAQVIQALDRVYPRMSTYLIDEGGALRPHVNIFVNGEMIADRQNLSDALGEGDTVHVMQALSGG